MQLWPTLWQEGRNTSLTDVLHHPRIFLLSLCPWLYQWFCMQDACPAVYGHISSKPVPGHKSSSVCPHMHLAYPLPSPGRGQDRLKERGKKTMVEPLAWSQKWMQPVKQGQCWWMPVWLHLSLLHGSRDIHCFSQLSTKLIWVKATMGRTLSHHCPSANCLGRPVWLT